MPAECAGIDFLSMTGFCGGMVFHFHHFVLKLIAFCFTAKFTCLGFFAGGSLPVMIKRLSGRTIATGASLRFGTGGILPDMTKGTAGSSTADFAGSRVVTGGSFVIMDHFTGRITAEGTGFDNFAVLCIRCGSTFYLRYLMLKLIAFGDAAALTGFGCAAGSGLPVMAKRVTGG